LSHNLVAQGMLRYYGWNKFSDPGREISRKRALIWKPTKRAADLYKGIGANEREKKLQCPMQSFLEGGWGGIRNPSFRAYSLGEKRSVSERSRLKAEMDFNVETLGKKPGEGILVGAWLRKA